MRSVRLRIALAVFVVVMVIASMAFYVTDVAYRHILSTLAEGTLEEGQRGFESLQASRTERLAIASEMLAGDAQVADAFARRDREELLALTYPRFERIRDQFDISREYFFLPDDEGTVFLRVYQGEAALDPENYGDASTSKILVQSRQTDSTQSGLELGRSRLSLRVTSPYRGKDGTLLGFTTMAEGVHDYLSAVSEQTGDAYALFISKSQLERDAWAEVQEQLGLEDTWDEYEEVVLVDSTLEDPATLNSFDPETITGDAKHLGYLTSNGSVFAAGVFPVLNAEGVAVGHVFVERDLTTVALTLRRVQIGLVTAFLLLAIVAAATSFLLVERMVFRRLDGTLGRSERMALAAAAGAATGSEIQASTAQDEFGRFERFFADLMQMVAGAIGARSNDPNIPEDED